MTDSHHPQHETTPKGEAHPLPPEESDVGLLVPIGIGLVVLVLLLIGMGVSAWLLYDRPATAHAPPSPLAFLDDPTPAPHLEYDPPIDLARLRLHEGELLDSYGWVDRSKQVVRIPVERALELIVQKGMPAEFQPKAQPANPQPAAADSGPPAESQSEAQPNETPAEEPPGENATPETSPETSVEEPSE